MAPACELSTEEQAFAIPLHDTASATNLPAFLNPMRRLAHIANHLTHVAYDSHHRIQAVSIGQKLVARPRP